MFVVPALVGRQKRRQSMDVTVPEATSEIGGAHRNTDGGGQKSDKTLGPIALEPAAA